MKASEVIAVLQRLITEHGDLPVVAQDGDDPSEWNTVESVCVSRPGDQYWDDELERRETAAIQMRTWMDQ